MCSAPIPSVPNSVGVKSEMVETLSVGEDGVETWVPRSVSEENSRSRNIERGSVVFEVEEEPSAPAFMAEGFLGAKAGGVSTPPGKGPSAAVPFFCSASFLCCSHLS